MTLTLLTAPGATGLLAIDKPAGMLVVPGRNPDGEGLSARALLEAQLARPVWVCHRIDRDTSGVVVFALDEASHRAASMAFEGQGVQKRYLALVRGRVTAPLEVTAALVEARKRTMRVAREGEAGKPAHSTVTPVELFAEASLVALTPHTGRQHQLRVHLRHVGHPLLFDHQYGHKQPLTAGELGGQGGEVVLGRTPLHAEWLKLETMGFEATAPLPADFTRALAVLRGA